MKVIKVDRITLDQVDSLLSGNACYYSGNSDSVVLDIEELRYQKSDNESDVYDKLIQIVDVMSQDEWIYLHL